MKISKNAKVGLFAFVGIIILFVGFNFMKGFNFLKPYSRYYIVYTNAGGVVKSTQVLINGFKIGQVDDVRLLEAGNAGKILVTIVVDGEIAMPKGTVAEIASSDLLGTKIINIKLGQSTEIVNPNDTLNAAMEEGLSEAISNLVSPIKEKSEQVLATLDKVLLSMNDVFDSTGTAKLSKGVDDLASTLGHVKNITGRLDNITRTQEGRINDMFAHTESIMRNLRNNNELLSHTIKNIKNITDSVAAADVTSTINNLNKSLAEMGTMLDKINKGEGTLGQLANNDALYKNLSSSSKELSLLLADMQKYPGRYFTVSVFGNSKRANKADKKRETDLKGSK